MKNLSIKRLVLIILFQLGAVLFIALAVYMAESYCDLVTRFSPIFAAPKITDQELVPGHENEIVWLYGRLIPRKNETLRTPLSEVECLYYRYEKYEVRWEEDSDGDHHRVYYPLENKEKSLDMILQMNTSGFKIMAQNITYYDLAKSVDLNETIGETEYNYREYIVPIENSAWVIGKISNGELIPTDRGVIICLNSVEFLFRQLKGETGLFLYFALLFLILGLGFLAGSLYVIFQKKITFISKHNFIAVLTIPLYLCIFGGVLLLVFSFTDLLQFIILGSMMTIFVNFPYLIFFASGGCKAKPLAALILFLAGIGMFISGVYLLNNAFFTMGAWLPSLIGGLVLVSGAIAPFLYYRLAVVTVNFSKGKQARSGNTG